MIIMLMTESEKGSPTSDVIDIGPHAQKSLYSHEGQGHVKRFRRVTVPRKLGIFL